MTRKASDTIVNELETGKTPHYGTDEYVVNLPRSLTLEEKKYLLAVERGDLPNVRRILQAANNPARSRVLLRFIQITL